MALRGGVAAFLLFGAAISYGATTSWQGDSSSNWSTGTNWTSGSRPGTGDVASFDSNFGVAGSQPVVSNARTIGEIIFAASLARSVTISGTQTLTLNGVAGIGIDNQQSANAVAITTRLQLGANQTWQGNSMTINSTVANGGRALTLSPNTGSTFSMGGVISGTGSLIKSAGGTVVLRAANTYTGITTLNAGVLSVSSLANGGLASNLGSSTSAAANLVFNGGTLLYTGTGSSTDRLFTLGVGGGTINASGTGVNGLNFTNTGAIAYAGTGARTLTLTGTSAPATTANNLAANLGDGTGGATSLVKDGSGTWRISGNNTFTGSVTVKDGLLQMNSAATNGAVPGSALIVGDSIGAAGSAIARNMQEGQVGNNSTVTIYSDGWFDINGGGYAEKGTVSGWKDETVGQVNLYGGRITTGLAGALNINASLPGAGISSFASSQTALVDATGGKVDLGGVTRTISVENGSQATDLEIRGAIANGAVTKAGTGQLSFTGTEANTYTGTTTVNAGTLVLAKSSGVAAIAGSAITVNSGGTLLLGSSNQINNAANLTLAGGTFSTGETIGFSETLGTLTLSGTSSIDLGTAAHLLNFADSSGLSGSWSGSLTIYGWTGLPNTSGTSGEIFFGSSLGGLTSSQLAMISFNGFGGGAILLTSGELVPMAVPEAETVLAAGFLVLIVCFRERRFLGSLLKANFWA
ncbi:MAG: autotransporter-associated beta strand repeat-containing protein [Verrucomicrobiae bacterium]